jgi:hypothetical protein
LEAKVQIRKAAVVVMSIAVLAMYGCTCTSDGLELDAPSNARADIFIDWHTLDGFTGTMTATAADGPAYSGPYLQVTPGVRSDQLAPLWEGWKPGRGWRSWSDEDRPALLETYDGMVLANLSSESCDRMRCRFRLDFPSLGMDGGGAGKCQLFGGRTIDAALSAEREEHARTDR